MEFHGKIYFDHRNAFSITKSIHNDIKNVIDMVCDSAMSHGKISTGFFREKFCNNMSSRDYEGCYKENFYKKPDGVFAIGLQTGHFHSSSNDLLYLNQMWVNNSITAGVYLIPSKTLRNFHGWDGNVANLKKCIKVLSECSGSVLVPVFCIEV